jgi:YhcH/YjgK/YiaL family protein
VILDTLDRAGRYTGLHPAFARAFDYLATADFGALAEGRHDVDGDRLFVLVQRSDGRGHEGAPLEAHRRYVDIQFTIEGAEEMGWRARAACHTPAGPFDDEKDIGFFADPPASWFSVPPGHFTIFFPDDAHAPVAGHGSVWKAVVKVAI